MFDIFRIIVWYEEYIEIKILKKNCKIVICLIRNLKKCILKNYNSKIC